MGTAEIAASLGVVLVAVVVIALIWVVSLRNINDETAEVRGHAERMVTAQALTLAAEIHQELAVVDQSLTILQEAWNRDQEHFDLLDWKQRVPALTGLARDIFIADEKGIVRQDILPAAIGQGIGGAYLPFPHDTLEIVPRAGEPSKIGQLIIAESDGGVETRRYLMYIVRPLAKPTHWLIGASYRTNDLVKLYTDVAIGINGMVALMDSKREILQAIAGPAARRPRTVLAKSAMMEAFNAKPSGTWTGPTAMDDVVRIHGFARVPGRDMVVTVGVAQTEAMAAADTLVAGGWWVALGGSAVVVLIGGLLLWEISNLRANRRHQKTFTRMQADLESAQGEVGLIRTRSAIASGRVATLLRVSKDGIAVLDADLCMEAWNPRFAAEIGIPNDVLAVGLPIDELFRQQTRAGLIGSGDHEDAEAMEAEIAQRVAILRTEPTAASLPQLSLDGRPRVIHADVAPDGGGIVLVLTEAGV